MLARPNTQENYGRWGVVRPSGWEGVRKDLFVFVGLGRLCAAAYVHNSQAFTVCTEQLHNHHACVAGPLQDRIALQHQIQTARQGVSGAMWR